MLLSRHTKRREFITLLGGAAAVASPVGTRATLPVTRSALIIGSAEASLLRA
jgi:hypothetical protein